MFLKLILALLVTFSVKSCTGYHVLLFHNMGTRSHLIQMAPLVGELLDHGHQVTAIIFGSLNINNENYTEILIPNYIEKVMEERSKRSMKGGTQNIFDPRYLMIEIQMWKELVKEMGTGMFEVEGVKNLLKNKPKVDGVITMWSFGLIFADIFDCPYIQFTTTGIFSFMLTGSGNQMNPSLQPNPTAPYIEPMTFLQRLGNHLLDKIGFVFFYWVENIITHQQNEYLGKQYPPPRQIMEDRFSVIIACSHYVTHGAWQYLPNVIEVGGLQLKDGKRLPENLQKFMDSSPDGVVFVSFGSSLKPDQMPEEKKNIFIESFRNLGMSVIWKWDEEISDLPSNVMISSWLPQQDLLAHPNLKVFVTHGGLGSLSEAIYHKATIVGIPFSNDQKPNLLRAVSHGYAKMLDWDTLNTDDLTEGIKSAMMDEEMKNAMEEVHSQYVDREVRPQEKAAWWIEFVCRHKGAKWLKPGMGDVPWYQYHHVDILVFLAVVILVILLIIFYTCRCFCMCCCGNKIKVD